MSLNKYQRSDAKGFVQVLGVLAASFVTGAATLALYRHGHHALALLFLFIHGNVCSLWISGVHELAHGTVFRTRLLNVVFARIFGILNWTDTGSYMATHSTHHRSTLQHDDHEREITCRALWFGSWLWHSTVNLPKLVGCLFQPSWILAIHLLLGWTFVSNGLWELVILVSLAPFYFGGLELLLNYAQHAGMKKNSDDLRESTRSLVLPAWLSFIHWHMEYHVEHHIYPSVPCYHLAQLREDIEVEAELPPRETLFQAWKSILKTRRPGECGHGLNPMQRITGYERRTDHQEKTRLHYG